MGRGKGGEGEGWGGEIWGGELRGEGKGRVEERRAGGNRRGCGVLLKGGWGEEEFERAAEWLYTGRVRCDSSIHRLKSNTTAVVCTEFLWEKLLTFVNFSQKIFLSQTSTCHVL